MLQFCEDIAQKSKEIRVFNFMKAFLPICTIFPKKLVVITYLEKKI